MTKPLCIYHSNCADGFGAAWVVRKFFDGNVDFFAAQYGQQPPDVAGRHVIMVDFSYKRPVLDAMTATASTITILDHHKTAAEDLAGLPRALSGDCNLPALEWHSHNNMPCRVRALFDMERSGAGLAWDYFFPDDVRPRLINHIEDRDLWRFALLDTREIQAAVVSHPWDFAAWDRLMAMGDREDGRRTLSAEGRAIDRKLQQDIGSILAAPPRRMRIGGVEVPVVNAPGMWASDMAGKMAETEPFAAIYFDTPTERVFSLRSRGEGGMDVSAIAKSYGGGGHKNAAGFQRPHGWEGDK
ncbi:phosphohydrolase [Sagittula sp.]|uniref:phosphohydrolase n=1 Tax=Sagittula sp. TaxID=2038081 RepID=UPI003519C424